MRNHDGRAAGLLLAAAIVGAACSSSGGDTMRTPDPGDPSATVEVRPPPTSWSEVDARLDALAATTSLLAAEVAPDGTFVVAHERAAERSLAIGGAFRLFVLGMLSDRIGGGDVEWDAELTIDERSRSATGGELHDRPDGSTVTVLEAARSMMTGSDDNATDLLIDTVGRELIEQVLPVMGIGEVSQTLMLPLLTTREHAILLGSGDPEARAAYATSSLDVRRRILASLPAGPRPPASSDPARPVALDSIGWFASAGELARTQLWLDSQRGLPGQEPLDAIVEVETGVDLDPATWIQHGFVGADDPGLVSMSWLLTRADGRRFVVSLVGNEDAAPVSRDEAAAIAAGVIDLLASS